jgi:hypothetical protein
MEDVRLPPSRRERFECRQQLRFKGGKKGVRATAGSTLKDHCVFFARDLKKLISFDL